MSWDVLSYDIKKPASMDAVSMDAGCLPKLSSVSPGVSYSIQAPSAPVMKPSGVFLFWYMAP